MLHARALVPLLLLATAPAQQGKDQPTVPSPAVVVDAKDLVAARLAGDWQFDEQVIQRLGYQAGRPNGMLHIDVTNKLPESMTAEVATRFAQRRVRAAGTMSESPTRSFAFALTIDDHGNTAFLVLHVRDGRIEECTEGPFALVAGATPDRDLLILPAKNGRLYALARGKAPAKSEQTAVAAGAPDVATAFTTVKRLLTEKKYLEMVQTLMTPKRRDEITRSGRTLDDWAAEFGRDSAPSMLELLRKTEGQEPEKSADGDSATYRNPEGIRRIRFVRVDGRWYLD